MNNFFENLTANEVEEIVISQDILDDFWNQVTGSDQSFASLNARHVFLEEFKKITSREMEGSDLNFKTLGWKITVKKHLIKGIVLTPALYAILSYLGITTGLAAIVIPTIIPILFDIENVELSRKEETIWLNLPLKKFRKQFKSAKEWYESLDIEIRNQVNYLDFQDFMEKLVFAGMAKANKNDKFLIFRKGENIFRLSLT